MFVSIKDLQKVAKLLFGRRNFYVVEVFPSEVDESEVASIALYVSLLFKAIGRTNTVRIVDYHNLLATWELL